MLCLLRSRLCGINPAPRCQHQVEAKIRHREDGRPSYRNTTGAAERLADCIVLFSTVDLRHPCRAFPTPSEVLVLDQWRRRDERE